jgi:hypothetical protein
MCPLDHLQAVLQTTSIYKTPTNYQIDLKYFVLTIVVITKFVTDVQNRSHNVNIIELHNYKCSKK